MPTNEASAFHSDQLASNLQLINQLGQLLDVDTSNLNNTDVFLTKLRQLQNLLYASQNRLDMFDLILPIIQQHYIEMLNLAQILNE